MRIAVIGATGMVGSRIVAEAAQRGHEVLPCSRSGKDVHGIAGRTLDITDEDAIIALPTDVVVIAVPAKKDGMDGDELFAAHQDILASRPPVRLVVVSGMGALEPTPGVRVMDAPDYPEEWRTESGTNARIVDLYRGPVGEGLEWTLVSPPWTIEPGTRSTEYRVGGDAPVGERISAETFAVAVLDEIEDPQHRGVRYNVAD